MTSATCTSALPQAKSHQRFSVLRRILRLRLLRNQRKTLNNLDDEMLRDIGLSRAQARAEAARSDWDVPSNWRG